MKKISKAHSTHLKSGTILTTYDGDTIELLTDYSDFHSGYEYVSIEFDEDGISHRAPHTGFITAQEITHYYEG